jgi:hypothetical protein
MRFVVLVAVLGGCIEPSLDVCGGLACPDGSRCVERTDGAQCLVIADCAGKPDGDSCDPRTGQAGTCESGACAPIERCGNGVLEANETCDCGDETIATRAESGDLHNSDTDALAPCRTNCTLRRCGDAILDPTEQCEGAAIQASLSCSTFGFYEGSLGCNNLCIADTSGCAGRCGDGVVDPREYCDTSVPEGVGAACTDFGFATGVLGCSSLCSPSFADCRDISAVQELLPLSADMIDISEGPTPATAWVLRRGELDLFDELTGIKLIAATPTGTFAADVTSYGERAAVSYTDGTIRFFTATGSAGTLVAPQVCRQVEMTTDIALACLGVSGSAWWDGLAWGPLVAGTTDALEAIRLDDTSVIYTNYNGSTLQAMNLFKATPSSVTPMDGWTSTVQSLDYIPYGEPPTTGGYYGGLAYGGVDYGLVHYTGGYWEIVYGSAGIARVANVGGRTMWNDGSTEVARIPRRTTTSILGGAAGCTRFLSLASTGLCLATTLTGPKLYRFAGATSGMVVDLPVAGGQLADAVVTDNDVIYYTTRTAATGGTVPASSWTPPTNGNLVFDRFGGISGTSIVMLARGFQGYSWIAHQLNGGAWTFHSATSWDTAIATPDGFVASGENLGACHVYRFSNGQLSTIDTSTKCWTALWRSPSDAIWAAGPLGIRNITTQTTVVPMTAPATSVGAIAGRDDTHIWVAIGSGIWFWDGSTWTQQLDAPSARFDWISISNDRVIASSGGDSRTAWIYDSASSRWNEMHLPSDTTPLLEPMLRPWGIVYRTQAATLGYSVWHDAWP